MRVAGLAANRAAIDAAVGMSYADALSNERRLQSQLSAAHDYIEGVAAFMAKRPATFTDR